MLASLVVGLALAMSKALASDWPDLTTAPPGAQRDGAADVALVVGIEDYLLPSVPDVPGARDNALAWVYYLKDVRGLGAVSVLLDADATRENMLTKARELRGLVGPGGRVWFVFVGHGALSKDGRDGVLIGSDAQQGERTLYARSLPQRELLDALGANQGTSVVAIVDACFSGQTAAGPIAPGLQPLIPVVLETPPPTVTVLTAGDAREFAGALPGLDRPAFSWLALGALRGWADTDGDGTVSAMEVISYARLRLFELVPDRAQTPQLAGDGHIPLARGADPAPRLPSARRPVTEPAAVAVPPPPAASVPSQQVRARASEPSTPASSAKATARAGLLGYAMVRMEASSFTMGSPSDEPGRGDDEAEHRVVLSRSYMLGATEVTQGLWTEVMGNNPSHFKACGAACPVEQVSWCDALRFANALSALEGLTPVYTGVETCGTDTDSVAWSPTADGYRLPTEAEWEHAARAGVAPSDDLDAVAWFRGNSTRRTHPVGQKSANAWGLHDMRGNVWEWVWDRYGAYGARATDPRGPDVGPKRVGRGGGYNSDNGRVRLAVRVAGLATDRDTDVGLRLARTVP